MGRKLLKVLMVIGVLIVVGIIASVWLVWKRPLKVDALFSRAALGKIGFEKGVVATSEGKMTVWQAGSGQCMVLLHGAGDQAGSWARMVAPLVEDYRVVIPDLPGHWKSDPKDGPLGIDQVLAGLEATSRLADGGPFEIGIPVVGREGLLEEDRRLLDFTTRFEQTFIHQEAVRRTIGETLDLGAQLLDEFGAGGTC